MRIQSGADETIILFSPTSGGHSADKLTGGNMTIFEAPNSQAKQTISDIELPHRFDVHEVIRMTS